MAAAVLLLTAPAFQGFSQDLLKITENSSASLTASWDGVSATVTPLAADHWQITLPVQVVISGGEGLGGDAIAEPAGEVGWNNVTTSPANTFVNVVDVVSDSPTTSAFAAVLPNNVPTPGGTLLTASGGGVPFNVQFNDLGDGPGTGTVPEGGSTALLALPAILALFAMARLRKSSIPV